jgi:hypothetical protein
MRWISIALFFFIGIELIREGRVAYHNHAVWATTGGIKSGPLTPGMAVFLGAVFIVCAIYLMLASTKKEHEFSDTAASKRKRSGKRR